jgi:hypothetical protein
MDSSGYFGSHRSCVLCATCVNAVPGSEGAPIRCSADARAETFRCDSYVRIFGGARHAPRTPPSRMPGNGN